MKNRKSLTENRLIFSGAKRKGMAMRMDSFPYNAISPVATKFHKVADYFDKLVKK